MAIVLGFSRADTGFALAAAVDPQTGELVILRSPEHPDRPAKYCGAELSENLTLSLRPAPDSIDGEAGESVIWQVQNDLAGEVVRIGADTEDRIGTHEDVELPPASQMPTDFYPRLLIDGALASFPAEFSLDEQSYRTWLANYEANDPRNIRPAHRDHETLPSIRMIPTNEATGRNRLCGQPDLPVGVDWPSVRGIPLPFLLQLDLADVQRLLPNGHLPEAGLLLAFYCPFDIDDTDETPFTEQQLLEMPYESSKILLVDPDSPTAMADWPSGLHEFFRYDGSALDLVVEQTRQTLTFDINDPLLPKPANGYQKWQEQKEQYESGLMDGPLHRILGHADYIQPYFLGDMLLQIDHFPGQEWGDGGRIYFTVPNLNLLEADLSNLTVMETSH